MTSDIYPKDFFERRVKIDPKLCFIIMPFRDRYDGIKKAIDAILKQQGFEAVHAKDIQQAGVIHTDIWDHIQRAAVIIAEVSEYNPNVYFELGVAMTVKDKSRLIIIREASSKEQYPFDISIFRCLHYSIDTEKGFRELEMNLRNYLDKISSEDDFLKSAMDRMKEWENVEYEYDRLLQISDLKLLKRRLGEEDLDRRLCAYAFASAMYYGSDCKFWSDLNKDNEMVVQPAANLVCGRYIRPGYRALYALQFMSEGVIKETMDNVGLRMGDREFALRIADAVMQKEVAKLVENEAGRRIGHDEAQKLLIQFKRWDNI